MPEFYVKISRKIFFPDFFFGGGGGGAPHVAARPQHAFGRLCMTTKFDTTHRR